MKQVRRKILLSVGIHPEQGTYIHICQAVRGSGLKRRNILQLFSEFMDDCEYDKSEKGELIDYLVLQSQKLSTDE